VVSEGVEERRVHVERTVGVVAREPDSFAIQGIVGAGEVLLLALVDWMGELADVDK
jgi:hypothetical protein